MAAFCAATVLVCADQVAAQDSDQPPESVHGIVVNSITHELISRALVASPDNHFATMTDSQGHFEFILSKPQTPEEQATTTAVERPTSLIARKPGYLVEPGASEQIEPSTKELTLTLVPEALIIGQVRLSESEGANKIQVEIYRRQVQEGRAHWIPSGQATTRSNGEFRFPELPAGTYKVFTQEAMDRDVTILPPEGEQLYGYPPVYFPDATDFGAAEAITLTPGQTFEADLSITRQPYYPVKIPVNGLLPDAGLAANVSLAEGRGPGYSLGYIAQTHKLEGLLPQGNFTVQLTGFGSTTVVGESTLTVRKVTSAAPITLVAAPTIPVHVKEEFTVAGETEGVEARIVSPLPGPGRYLNLRLESAEDFGEQKTINLEPPKGDNDRTLVLEATPPGKYFVHVDASRGYAASILSRGVDLMREPLIVANGSSTPAIEITMRDDGAQIDGTVEGADPALTAYNVGVAAQYGINPPGAHTNFAYIYCLPVADSPGRYAEAVASPDGRFAVPNLTPGTYRVLAFKHPQQDLEYQNVEAMFPFEAKGQVVRLTGAQTEHMNLKLTTVGE